MKHRILLSVLFLILSDKVFAEPKSFNDLVTVFASAEAAVPENLTGTFVGECFLSPEAYKYERANVSANITATNANLLLGKSEADGFHLVMAASNSLLDKGESAPGAGRADYAKDYLANKQQYLDLLAAEKPIQIAEDGTLATYSRNEYNFKQEFRMTSEGPIVKVTGGFDAPPGLNGVQAVCFWYQKLE